MADLDSATYCELDNIPENCGIETTPEMIEAGYDAFINEGGLIDEMTSSDRASMFSSIFSAMLSVWVNAKRRNEDKLFPTRR